MALLDLAAQGNQLAGLLAQRRNQPIPIQQGPGPGAPNPASAAPMAPMPQRPQSRIQPMSVRPAPQAPRGADPALLGRAQPSPGGGGGGGGILGALGGIVGGADDPRLSGEQNESAWKQGLKAAGIVGLGVLTGGLGPGAAALAGITVGRNEADKARSEALNISREQALLREQAEVDDILASGNLLDRDSRLQTLGTLMQRGHAETAEWLLEMDEKLSERSMAEEVDVLRDQFADELANAEDAGPEFMLDLSARMGAQGLETQAAALREAATAMEDIRQMRGELEWINTGAAQIAVDGQGNEVARFENSMDPYERAQIARDYAKMEQLKLEGASEEYLNNYSELRNEFRSEAQDYAEVANLTAAAKLAAENGVGDRVLVNALAKLVDPAGRITDADVQIYVESAGIRDRWQQDFENLMNNEGRLPAELRRNLVEQVDQLRGIVERKYRENLIDPYRIASARAGVNPNDFIFNPFADEREVYEPLGDPNAIPETLNPGANSGGGGNPFITGGGR